jgi:hypothetical protein
MSAEAASVRRALQLTVIVVMAMGSADVSAAGDPDDAARVRRAITYLDGRQNEWSRAARTQRGEGADRTSCVSCHTGISHALSRPALQRFVARDGASAPEERMIAAVTLRVNHWAELDSPRYRLMYDSDDDKKLESRGTEAVANALVLARRDAARQRTSPSAATRTALRHLWETQTTEDDDAGSWDWLNFGLQPWEGNGSRAFGAALAAIAVGSAPGYLDDKADAAAATGAGLLRQYLRRRFPNESLYNRVWIFEASTQLKGVLSADEAREVVTQLHAAQHDDGGWSLAALGPYKRVDGSAQPTDSDAYATGLALHALLRAGTPAKRPDVAKGLAWLRSHQQADGSWRGRSVNKERDPATFAGKLMTDAATAISAAALVEADGR